MTINVVIVEGNLGDDPRIIETRNGGQLASLSMAINHPYKDPNGDWQNKVSWTNLICFIPSRIEKIIQLKKGAHIIVEGEFDTNQWTDKQGGNHNDPCIKINDIKELAVIYTNNQPQTQTFGSQQNNYQNRNSNYYDNEQNEFGGQAPQQFNNQPQQQYNTQQRYSNSSKMQNNGRGNFGGGYKNY